MKSVFFSVNHRGMVYMGKHLILFSTNIAFFDFFCTQKTLNMTPRSNQTQNTPRPMLCIQPFHNFLDNHPHSYPFHA
ncbi:hypothetical protein G7K_0772-t1 [Saitoella complicata NRRL Y-17804]|uniref:Uncharacterized protein n=1 Tax=Saitoella complicata (strain BCRC 22490 / CBS 7301 / JCM 7358 / NBRC 10748 / NRRL Y-17804) TaxID=698492 RepID=A0A0E9N9H5_SAICN|nr:hypothetical protein G7K_0772-t1 [Saitoella complicata NRRL Y-17804]